MGNNFYTPEEVRALYGSIVPTYQVAFAGEPWNEVSKCADKQMRCIGGLSALAIGGFCDTCGQCPTLPAYEEDELIERFDNLGRTRPTAWYVEQSEIGLTMAAVAWRSTASAIVAEKYPDVPDMANWMVERLGSEPIMWLDEVFANKDLKAKGNLQNFSSFIVGLAKILDCSTVAYRTKEPRMIAAPARDFGSNADILTRFKPVPDRRDFVIIKKLEEKT